MLRFLIWNIESFTKDRIDDTSGATTAEQMDNEQRSYANLLYILNTVYEAKPDLFVILEARCSQGKVEELASGEGANGLLRLGKLLRTFDSDQWCLVPPLRVNPRDNLGLNTHTETVGVFYRQDRLQFTGPYVWPAAAKDTGPPQPSGVLTSTYPKPWSKLVPEGTTAAARCRFYKNDTEIIFAAPTAKNYEFTRRPYLTSFTELTGQKRNFKLFSIHTKPGISARDAMLRMSGMQKQDWVPAEGEFTVFAGDFNLNLLNIEDSPDALALEEFEKVGLYFLKPFNPTTAKFPYSRILRREQAWPDQYAEAQFLDYGFVRYTKTALPVPLAQPFQAVVAEKISGVKPTGNPPLAALPTFLSDMKTKLPDINNLPTDQWINIASVSRFNEVCTLKTIGPHGLLPGKTFRVADVTNAAFDGIFFVDRVVDATTICYGQKNEPASVSGGGAISVLPRRNAFLLRENFGHLTRPRAGTSDHLPVFMLL